jgi:predicted RNA-binding protein with PUA-like domain
VFVVLVGVAERVAQEGHAHFAYDSQLEQTGVEGVAQVVEADVADSGPANRCPPAGFQVSDRFAMESENEAVRFLLFKEQAKNAVSERNLAGFALGGL